MVESAREILGKRFVDALKWLRCACSNVFTDWSLSLKVVDDSCLSDNDALQVNLFREDPNMLPRVRDIGDIVMFTQMRVQFFNERKQCVSTQLSTFNVLWSKDHQPIVGTYANRIQDLSKWWRTQQSRFTRDLTHGPKRPTLETKDLNERISYFDYIGKIIDIKNQLNRATIFLTDYTENHRIRSSVGSFEFPQTATIFSCTLWDENSKAASALSAGSYVLLRNVRLKVHEGGLEGAMHGDSRQRSKVTQLADNDSRLEPLQKFVFISFMLSCPQ
ncbi:hypothetical protein M427DRAFT_448337 [Gonapodya prolifera JEL478]|uniref:Protection of telomeres protein 1 n=1 Tax=Gonapodya prolifera (strain JEL478) TaxID=1344416 RepID=A0A139ARR8_GONPJ|nr:hypothetical protein M427DRAFT_448337 [Gonapodya prolifera JEL478]|eukprot:KXS19354.1 hypothetical protein M427DRAFT_448337 [Gonapodya prolifera JEL478]